MKHSKHTFLLTFLLSISASQTTLPHASKILTKLRNFFFIKIITKKLDCRLVHKKRDINNRFKNSEESKFIGSPWLRWVTKP